MSKFDSPEGRIHQNSKMFPNYMNMNQRLNPNQNAPIRRSLFFSNPQRSQDQEYTAPQRMEQQWIYQPNVNNPTMELQNNNIEKTDHNRNESITMLFRNGNSYSTLIDQRGDHRGETQNPQHTQIFNNNNPFLNNPPTNRIQTISNTYQNHQKILHVNKPQHSHQKRQEKISHPNNSLSKSQKDKQKYQNSLTRSLPNRDHVDQKPNRQNNINQANNIQQCNKPQNVRIPPSNQKSQFMKNQQVSKVNLHKNKKAIQQKKAAQESTAENEKGYNQIPLWFGGIQTAITQPVFHYLPPQQVKQIRENYPINTRSEQFQKMLRTPLQMACRQSSEMLEIYQNQFKKPKNNSKQIPQCNSYDKVKIAKLTPFELLEMRNKSINPQIKQDKNQSYQNKRFFYQNHLYQSGTSFLDSILFQRQMNSQPQYIFYKSKRYDQRLNFSKQNQPNTNPQSQSKSKNQSTNDKTTASKKSNFFKNNKFQDQLPKVSEFNISSYDKPFTKKYNITIDNYECKNKLWFLEKLNINIKKIYSGEVKFERYTSQIKVNDALIRDIFQKKPQLLEFFKNSKSTQKQYGLIQWFPSRFDSQLQGLLIFPLKLQLPQGYDYFYSFYSGDSIQGLVIFNSFAQIIFTESIKIKIKCEEQRDLRNKIRFDNDGIWIGCQMLKRKCKFMFWKTEEQLMQFENEQLTEEDISTKILPMNKDGKAKEVYYDAMIPARFYGEIEWEKEKTQKKYSKEFIMVLICMLILVSFVNVVK